MVNEQELTTLTPVIGINFAIMLNALFFIAGYFSPTSYNKGTRNYLISRLKRIGSPFLLFALSILILKYFFHILSCPQDYVGFFDYFNHYYLGFGGKPLDWGSHRWPEISYAHFWFLEYLFVFSIGYILTRKIKENLTRNDKSDLKPNINMRLSLPSISNILLFILTVASAAYIIRLWFSANVWIAVLKFILIEPAHLPHNIAFFVLGTIAYKNDWLNRLSQNDARFWMINASIAAILIFISNSYRPLNHSDNMGGFTIGSALFCIWELYFAVSWLISLLWLFRKKFNRSTRLNLWLAQNSYVSYMLHGFIILAIQMSLIPLDLPLVIKFIFVFITGLPLSYISASIFRRLIPFARKYW